MSVWLTVPAYVVPIFREPGDPGKKLILARWHSAALLTGDASGGSWTLITTMDAVGRLWGPHALYDIKTVCWWTPSTVAGAYGNLIHLSYERSTNEPLSWKGTFYDDDSNIRMDTVIPDYKYRFSDDPTQVAQIQVYVYPNTNLVQMHLSVGGYVYDERYLP